MLFVKEISFVFLEIKTIFLALKGSTEQWLIEMH